MLVSIYSNTKSNDKYICEQNDFLRFFLKNVFAISKFVRASEFGVVGKTTVP